MLDAEMRGSVLHLLLNRPEVRNAFDERLIEALADAFADLPSGVRAVVLAGRGKVFCAGGDLDWMRRMAAHPEAENTRDAERLAGLFQTIADCPAFTLARLHGAVYGGGLGLAAACDQAVALAGTRFCFSEARLGLIPATISRVVTPKIGPGAARWLFASAREFDTTTALRLGLIHHVAGDEAALDAEVDVSLEAVLRCGPSAVAEAKRLVLDPPAGPAEAARRLAAVRSGDEGREGISAFLEKRIPGWVPFPGVPQPAPKEGGA